MEERRCPYCDEVISLNAKKCKHCGEYLDPVWQKIEENRLMTPKKRFLRYFCLPGFWELLGYTDSMSEKQVPLFYSF